MFAKIVRTLQLLILDKNNYKIFILPQFVTIFALFGIASAAILPAAFITPYAVSHNEHVVNHAIAAPVAAPVFSSPYIAAPAAYSAAPVFF